MKPLVIGVGNRDRGSDGIGPLMVDVVDELEFDVDTCVIEGDLSDLALRWQADQQVIIVDAMVSGAAPGSIVEIDALEEALPTETGLLSSHGISLSDAVELSRLLDRMPAKLTVLGVEAHSFDELEPVEDEVLESVGDLVDRISTLLTEPARTQSSRDQGHPHA